MSRYWADQNDLPPLNIDLSSNASSTHLEYTHSVNSYIAPYQFQKVGQYKIVENTQECLEAIKPYLANVRVCDLINNI